MIVKPCAATHPIKHTRLSLNFQITFENKNNVLKNKKFYFTNKNFDEKNLINLKFLGYKIFKKRKKYNKIFSKKNTTELNFIYQKLKLKKINLNSIKEDVHWTKDQWLKLIE